MTSKGKSTATYNSEEAHGNWLLQTQHKVRVGHLVCFPSQSGVDPNAMRSFPNMLGYIYATTSTFHKRNGKTSICPFGF